MIEKMTVITRFAPSPTGFLHIGSARTALFNWLYAHHHGGKFLLRIEDTDRKRLTQEAIEAIINGIKWLGLDWEGVPVYQFARRERHIEMAYKLLDEGRAYRCYSSPEELQNMRDKSRQAGLPPRYDGRWRNRDSKEAPKDTLPVIRLKAQQEGETLVKDLVQGPIIVRNNQLDDMVLLRADGTPTYMLSVVVDDHDMGITHVIRGDDHITNSFRQTQLYKALNWGAPQFAHIPLIHGSDGAKLSKRHGALGVEAYRDMGFLPEAMNNYLLRLGWGHGDEEIISQERAIDWFDLDAVGKSPAQFDMAKLLNFNGHYIRRADDLHLLKLIDPLLTKQPGYPLDEVLMSRLLRGMGELKVRAKTLVELFESSLFYVSPSPIPMEDKALQSLDEEARCLLGFVHEVLSSLTQWSHDGLENALREYADKQSTKFGKVAQPLRAALTGRRVSPGIFDVMLVLGREESLKRIADVMKP
jgi:glutamyl-tRNA synthetase